MSTTRYVLRAFNGFIADDSLITSNPLRALKFKTAVDAARYKHENCGKAVKIQKLSNKPL